MQALLWLWTTGALAGAPLDADAVCSAAERVAVSPRVASRLGRRAGAGCPSLVSSQTIADYMRAFAVLQRELQQAPVAAQLTQQVKARWLIIDQGADYALYDAEVSAFVDVSPFLKGTAPPPEPTAAAAYQAAFRAMRARKTAQARTLLQECLTLDPEYTSCHWEMGWVHWVDEDWSAALASWERVAALDATHPELDEWLPQARERAGADTPAPPAPVAVQTEPDTTTRPTLCEPTESVLFSCPIADRLVSLCQQPETSHTRLRLGPPGGAQLVYPRSPEPLQAAFSVLSSSEDALLARPAETTLGFVLDGNTYALYEHAAEASKPTQGLRVHVAGLAEVELPCTTPSPERLSELRE